MTFILGILVPRSAAQWLATISSLKGSHMWILFLAEC